MARKNNEYFDGFISLVELSCKAAEYLHDVFSDFNPATLPERMRSLHEIEHQADLCKHELMRKLAQEFVTPIEREDIILMVNELDDVTDKIEDVLIRIYMYNITQLRPAALAFSSVIVRCCTALRTAIDEFPNFRKSQTLHQAIIVVNTMEEEGDSIYIEAVRDLYVTEPNAIKVVAWSETFDRLEDCCDACEHVANVMESVIMKNS